MNDLVDELLTLLYSGKTRIEEAINKLEKLQSTQNAPSTPLPKRARKGRPLKENASIVARKKLLPVQSVRLSKAPLSRTSTKGRAKTNSAPAQRGKAKP